MKNNLKRIAIILPVIALLLAFLAVPAAADYSPETGWSEPVGVIEGPLQITCYIGGGRETTLDFVGYKVVVDLDSVPENTELFNSSTGYCIAYLGANPGYYRLSALEVVDDRSVRTLYYGETQSYTRDYFELVLYVFDYPDDLQAYSEQWQSVGFEVYEVSSPSTTEPIFSVWTDIMTWITSALTSVMGAFYVDGSLTLLGTLACIGVSVGIGFLLIGLIQRFLKLRG